MPIRISHVAFTCTVLVMCLPMAGWAQDGGFTSPAEDLERAVLLQRLMEAEERLSRLEAVDQMPPVPAPPPSLADDVVQRLNSIEKTLNKQADAAAKKKLDDASKPTMKWTGRIQADYWAFPGQSPGEDAFESGDSMNPVDDRFLFRRLRIGVQGDIPDFMLYKLEVDFNNPNSPQLKDNFIGWNDLPFFQTVLLGNQKRPYGLDSIESSRYTVFLERPAIVDALNTDSRRFGLVSYGISDDERFNWRYGGFMGRDLQNIGTALATPSGGYQAEFDGRLAQTAWYECDGRNYLHLAMSGVTASTDGNAGSASTAQFTSRPEARTSNRWIDTGVISGAESYQITGTEALLNVGQLQVVGEYLRAWVQRDGFNDVSFQGGYVYVAYFLTDDYMPWDRKTGQLARIVPQHNFFMVRDPEGKQPGWGAWQIAARYSYADLTDADIMGGIDSTMTLALNWYWNSYARMQIDYINGNIHDHNEVDGFTAGSFQSIGTRFSVEF
ncbi:hypothetical protein GC163_06250 [bacterium]|nr:hypothetical protein [bacterium]